LPDDIQANASLNLKIVIFMLLFFLKS